MSMVDPFLFDPFSFSIFLLAEKILVDIIGLPFGGGLSISTNKTLKGELEMKKKLSSYKALIGFLSLFLFLTLATFAQAEPIVTTWTGAVRFSVKVVKPTKQKTRTFVGTMNLYWDSDTGGIAQNVACGLELIGVDASDNSPVTFCFTQVFGSESDDRIPTKTGYKSSFGFIAAGTVNTINVVDGMSFMNGKGIIQEDVSSDPISIKIGGIIYGGGKNDKGKMFIFSGTIPTTTLTP